MSDYKYSELTEKIIGAAHAVHNSLGYGFLEKVYHNAMMVELRDRGINAEPQKAIEVQYGGHIVGEYFADFVIEEKVIVEIKAATNWAAAFEAQLLNYLKACGMEVGLVINFGPSVQVKRMVR